MNLTDSYFLDPCDGGGPDNGTGTPLSRAQMKQPNSYAGWDFWGIGNDGFRVPWFMPEDGYPRLVWTALGVVPDVGGLPIERAATMLEGAGIHVDQIVYDYDHTAQDRYVITASPSPAVPPGSVMNLILSLGPYDWSTNSGTGDSNSPYLVISPGQLDCLAHQPQLWSRRFKLISDLDMKWRVYDRPLLGWSEVSRSVFDGIFDGNGHIISNLTIDADSTDGDMREMLGLFGEIGSSGSVKDLGLVDVFVGARRYQEKTAGMLCAVNGGHIERCYGRGVLQGYGKLGGLAGSNTGVVEDCYTGGEIKAWPSWGDGLYAGLVAENTVGAVRTSYTTCLVSSSFGAGLVAFTGSGPVEHSLWDVETSGVQTSKGGMGVTTSQLMDMEFLRGNGWGGNPNWIIDDGKDYPHLIWEGMPGSLIPEKPRR